jgi:predicted aspartyl protease
MPENIKYYPLDLEYGKIVREISTPVTIYSSFSSSNSKIVTTSAVWDTGANHSVLSPKIVQELELCTVDSKLVHGINNSRCLSDVVLATIKITDDLILTDRRFSVNTIPGTDVLIGMDIIMLGNFVINNTDGKTLFSFVIPPVKEKISFSKIVDKLNKI